MVEMSQHPNIAALKEAGDSLDKLAYFMEVLGDRLHLYAGNDAHVIPTLALGGSGVISVVSNILPYEMMELYRKWKGGDYEAARQMQLTFLPLIRLLFEDVNPAPLKCALHMMGVCEEDVRLPLSPVSPQLKQRIGDWLGLIN
jgi:4-hydroxy-tetrahydrodipicolinate synthase